LSIIMQPEGHRLGSKKLVMRNGRSGSWALVAAVLILLTLAVIYIYAKYGRRMPATVPGLKSPDSSVTTRGAKFQDLKSVNSIGDQKPIVDKSRRPETASSGIDESVVDQPFQISSSIREGCKSDTIECPLVMASAARMAKEPRDIDWAAKMEERIQAAVDMQAAGNFVIRNLECRTSICILEVECRSGTFTARYDDVITSSLRPDALTISAPEYDPSGTRFHVELMDFARR
jgi:hypothetical protein